MPKQARQAMIFVAFAIVVALMMSIFSRFEDWKRAFTVNRADIGSVLVAEPRSEVVASIEQWAESQPKWSLESSQEIQGGIELHLTRTTRVIRFVDDAYVRLFIDGDRTMIDLSSQSRIGKGDLGQNQRNLEEILAIFEGKLISRSRPGDER